MNSLRRISTYIFFLVSSVAAQLTYANVTYTYTGNTFTSVHDDPNVPGSYDTSMRVSGSFELSTALPPNRAISDRLFVTPLSFSFGDGRSVITNTSPSLNFFINVGTDAAGNITKWDLAFQSQSGLARSTIRTQNPTNFTPPGVQNDSGQYGVSPVFPGPEDGARNSDVPGSWTAAVLAGPQQPQTRPELQALTVVPSGITVAAPLKRNAVILVHGWNSNPDGWAKPMAEKIRHIIDLRAPPDELWEVMYLDWSVFSGVALPRSAYTNARAVGTLLGKVLTTAGYDHIHFIAHSAGSNLIENAAVRVKLLSPSEHKPVIHSTFLDAYDPNGNSATYGFSATWAEHYVDKRLPLLILNTDLKLPGAYNWDVTALDVRPFLVDPVEMHAWPYLWYRETVDDRNLSNVGFGNAIESGRNALLNNLLFPKGDECPMVSNSTLCLTTPSTIPAVRSTPIANPFNIWANPGLVTTTQSPTGSVALTTPQVIGLTNNSPVWVSLAANIAQGFNTLEIDYRFTVEAEGLLSVFIDNDVAFKADQRQAVAGVNPSGRLSLGNIAPGPHTLSFRLDHMTSALSAVEISNIRTSNVSIVRELNVTPTANAGKKQNVRLGVVVNLDGGASHDPDNKPLPLTYLWKQTSGPPVSLFHPTTIRPSFTPTTKGHYEFALAVNDGQSDSNISIVKIHASKNGELDE
jgi:pimeloyl-ACP methyl ester carboxylesterase